jgi:hypothetical protein
LFNNFSISARFSAGNLSSQYIAFCSWFMPYFPN